MRSASSIALVAALCSLSFAQYQCPLATTGQDAAALSYAFAIQDLLTNYYDSQNFSNTDLFVPTASVSASAVDLSSNFLGLQTQATIGRDAIAALGNMRPNCQYNYPPTVENGTMILIENAFRLEASLCGAFIGLADYVESPISAFLVARLAAEHGIHAAYLLSYMTGTPFNANSTSLTAAFTPDYVLGTSNAVPFDVGRLGQFLGAGCVVAPSAPCGATVSFGPALAALSGATGTMVSLSTCAPVVGSVALGSMSAATMSASMQSGMSMSASAITNMVVMTTTVTSGVASGYITVGSSSASVTAGTAVSGPNMSTSTIPGGVGYTSLPIIASVSTGALAGTMATASMGLLTTTPTILPATVSTTMVATPTVVVAPSVSIQPFLGAASGGLSFSEWTVLAAVVAALALI